MAPFFAVSLELCLAPLCAIWLVLALSDSVSIELWLRRTLALSSLYLLPVTSLALLLCSLCEVPRPLRCLNELSSIDKVLKLKF